jgi:uncharacterized membrane protein YvlD (DUF360 family)
VQSTGERVLRPEHQRPSLRQVVWRTSVVAVVNALALGLLALLLSGFSVDSVAAALLAGLLVGLVNTVVWPALAVVLVPLSVLTLGIGSFVVNVIVVGFVLDAMNGVTLDGFWTVAAVVVGLTILTTAIDAALALDDDAWFDRRTAHRAARRSKGAPATDVPGIVFVQLDGVARQVLLRAMASGDVPTLRKWITEGSHLLRGWETDWSSQTGVSQCGILHGSVEGMPAFRWLEKDTGQLVVSNHPSSAAEIERRHSDGNGLLAHHGSSYGNLFSGDAERAVLTMSGVAKVKEGKIGAGYRNYFARPDQAIRTFNAAVMEISRERRARRQQIRAGVEPRVERDYTYAFLRAFTTIVSRDISVAGILDDMAEGRAAIYVDFLGYDEVSHHSGPERYDTLAVLRDLDRQIARIDRARAWVRRPYHIVVLSDHGQTQGPPFAEVHGESLAELVGRLVGTGTATDADAESGNTESTAWFRSTKSDLADPSATGSADTSPTVLGSGSLGLVYLPGPPRRLTLEEIDTAHPGLVEGLRRHAGIGFVLVRSSERGALVLGADGMRVLGETAADDVVEGEDPLAAFGPTAADKVRRVDRCPNVADLMVNSTYDPVLDEVQAFEHQVGSHGGLGGPQTHPFVLVPAGLTPPDHVIEGSAALHRVLKGWLVEVGQPVR